jgi:hypothetical protein
VGLFDVFGIEHVEQVIDKIIEAKGAVPTRASPVPLVEADYVEILREASHYAVPQVPTRCQGVNKYDASRGWLRAPFPLN